VFELSWKLLFETIFITSKLQGCRDKKRRHFVNNSVHNAIKLSKFASKWMRDQFLSRVSEILLWQIRPCVRLSVCPSVCPSQPGIVSKRMHNCTYRQKLYYFHHLVGTWLFFQRYRRYKIPKGTHSAGAINTRRVWERICDFRQKSPFISETLRDRPRLLWITNSKSQAADRSVSASMTLNDLKRRNVRVKIFCQISIINARTIWHKITECGTATQVGRSIFLGVSQVPIPGATGEASSVPNFWDLRQNGLT